MIIKRKYYSNPTLEQKEYGLKNSIRKQLGKFVEKGSDYYRKKNNRLVEELDKKLTENKPLANKLVREADKRGIKIIDNDNYKSITSIDASDAIDKPSKKLVDLAKNMKKNPKEVEKLNMETFGNLGEENNKILKRESLKVLNKVATESPIIALKQKYTKGSNIMAHEIGHEISRKSSGKAREITEKVDKLGENPNIISTIKAQRLKIKNEKNANKNGEKLLKELGANKEELKEYKKYRKEALKTYKTAENSRILGKIADKIDPSRKNRLPNNMTFTKENKL